MALRPLNIISLCTGGGGLDLGVELAMPSARSVVCVEREAFACGHLVSAMQSGLMADAPVWSDVTTFDGRPWRGLVDGVIGGIPCQPHSLAGKRLGEDDERDLWSDARRIIVQSGAWFVLIENVRGMLSSGGAERVWRDLRRLGFTVEGGLFTAAETGASHERERIFILAVAERRRAMADRASTGWGRQRPVSGPEPGGRSGASRRLQPGRLGGEIYGDAGHPISSGHHGRPDGEIRGSIGRTVAEGAGERDDLGLYPPGPSDLDGWRRVLAHSPELEPAVRRMADGVAARLDLSGPHAARVDRLRMLGNGVVCLQSAYAVRTLATRLAASGSAGARKLVRMMGET